MSMLNNAVTNIATGDKGSLSAASLGLGMFALNGGGGVFSLFGLSSLSSILLTCAFAVVGVVVLALLAKLFVKKLWPKIKAKKEKAKINSDARQKILKEANQSLSGLRQGKNYHVGMVNGALIGKDPKKMYFAIVGQKDKNGKIKIVSAENKDKPVWVDKKCLKNTDLIIDLDNSPDMVQRLTEAGKKAWTRTATIEQKQAGNKWALDHPEAKDAGKDTKGKVSTSGQDVTDEQAAPGFLSGKDGKKGPQAEGKKAGTKTGKEKSDKAAKAGKAVAPNGKAIGLNLEVAQQIKDQKLIKKINENLKKYPELQPYLVKLEKGLGKIEKKTKNAINDTPDTKEQNQIRKAADKAKKNLTNKFVKKFNRASTRMENKAAKKAKKQQSKNSKTNKKVSKKTR